MKQGAGLRSTGQRLWVSVRLSEGFLRRWHLGRGLKELGEWWASAGRAEGRAGAEAGGGAGVVGMRCTGLVWLVQGGSRGAGRRSSQTGAGEQLRKCLTGDPGGLWPLEGSEQCNSCCVENRFNSEEAG